MNKHFIPNDKFDIEGLTTCWKDICEECVTGEFEYDYFRELIKKTYDLFSKYGKDEKVPKELLFLFSRIHYYTMLEQPINELFELSKEIVLCLLYSFANTLGWNNDRVVFEKNILSDNKKVFAILYKNKPIDIDVETFSFNEFVV